VDLSAWQDVTLTFDVDKEGGQPDGDEFLTISSFGTEAVDLLGSGPVHLAAFVSGMLMGRTYVECLSMASAAASIKIEQQGLMFSLSMNRLLERAELLKESVRFH
jgi:sugar/nucleoside kinase (ribokinase family)